MVVGGGEGGADVDVDVSASVNMNYVIVFWYCVGGRAWVHLRACVRVCAYARG